MPFDHLASVAVESAAIVVIVLVLAGIVALVVTLRREHAYVPFLARPPWAAPEAAELAPAVPPVPAAEPAGCEYPRVAGGAS